MSRCCRLWWKHICALESLLRAATRQWLGLKGRCLSPYTTALIQHRLKHVVRNLKKAKDLPGGSFVKVSIEIWDSCSNLCNLLYMQKAAAQQDSRAQSSLLCSEWGQVTLTQQMSFSLVQPGRFFILIIGFYPLQGENRVCPGKKPACPENDSISLSLPFWLFSLPLIIFSLPPSTFPSVPAPLPTLGPILSH